MEKVGFFAGSDTAEALQAFAEQVDGKKKVEGLELTLAGPNPGFGSGGMRRIQALNRIDIPLCWRAVVRAGNKKDAPCVTIIPPRGQDVMSIAGKLAEAGLLVPPSPSSVGNLDCAFPPDAPAASMMDFAVKALRAIGYNTELQWTVRGKGLLPM